MLKKLKKLKPFFIGFLIAFTGSAIAAPVSNILRNIQSETTSTYEIGTSTNLWLNIFARYASTTALTASTTVAITFDGIATSTLYGNPNATSTLGRLSVNALNVSTTTATSTFSNGIQLSGGCFRLANGTCAGTSGITSLNGLTDGTQTFTNDTNVTISSAGSAHTLGWSGALSVARGGTNATSFTGSTLISANGAGTTFISSTTPSANQFFTTLTTATSTFLGGFSTNLLNVTSGTASSTFVGGIVVGGGTQLRTYNCSVYGNGGKLTTDANGYLTCGADLGGGGATVNNGTANRLAYYSAASTIDSGTNLLWNNTNLGVGTTAVAALTILGVQGNALVSGTTTVGSLIATSTLFIGPGGTSTITTEYALLNQHVVILEKSASVSLSNDVATAITFDGEIKDPWDLHSTSVNTSRITAKLEGTYLVEGASDMGANATGQRACWFQINGGNSPRYGGTSMAGTASNGNYIQCSALLPLKVGDYVEFMLNQNSGAALTVNTINSWLAKFEMILLSK